MHVQVATPAGSNVNTELPHKVQKCTDMARNTVNNKLTTSKHYKSSKATQQRVSVQYNPPTPQPLTAGPQTTHQQIGQGLGYTPMLALTEPPLRFESLAWPGFGLCPNPGENLATTFLRNRTDIKANNPPVQQIVPSLAKTCNSRGTLSARVLERCTRVVPEDVAALSVFTFACFGWFVLQGVVVKT